MTELRKMMGEAPERIWLWLDDGTRMVSYPHEPYPWDGVRYIRADLARPKVKPLEWADGKFRSGSPRETAESLLGTYEVLQWAQGDFGGSVPQDDPFASNREFCGAKSIEEAKAAAQADYERRILATLEVPK